ncbi:ABC transporter permease subunit [Salipaludibacillus sp. HK11]|uniref:ABC transporter permease subunit n=1 Tax=Salipaludibacillus sp. HK11 TaxID=3394320 RepID=UPI0039FD0A65
MKQFSKLVQNENMKIFRRVGTKVMFLLLLVVVVVIGLFSRFLFADEMHGQQSSNVGISVEVQGENEELPEEIRIQMEDEIALQDYYEKEGIEALTSKHAWNFIITNAQTIAFVTMFTVIVGAGIVASEHSNGTIKLLLIRPVKRWKILLSKWTATMIFSIVMLIALILFSFIVGAVLFQFDFGPNRWVSVVQGEIRDWHILQYAFTVYGLYFIELIIMTTFAFMIGTVFKNQSLAVGLSLVALFMGGQIVYLLSQYEWIKYILFSNTYLMQYVEQNPIIEGMTLSFSIVMLLGYFLLFMAIAMITFSKRDVAE